MITQYFLENAVNNFPDKPFLYYGDSKIAYQGLNSNTDRLAYSFLEMGIEKGDRIAIVAPNQTL